MVAVVSFLKRRGLRSVDPITAGLRNDECADQSCRLDASQELFNERGDLSGWPSVDSQDDETALAIRWVAQEIREVQIAGNQHPLLSLDQAIEVVVRKGCARQAASIHDVMSTCFERLSHRQRDVGVDQEFHGVLSEGDAISVSSARQEA